MMRNISKSFPPFYTLNFPMNHHVRLFIVRLALVCASLGWVSHNFRKGWKLDFPTHHTNHRNCLIKTLNSKTYKDDA